MQKGDIEDYIKKLQKLERDLSSDDADISLIKDLDNLLSSLNNDVTNTMVSSGNNLQVKVKKLWKDAVIPEYSKPGDAGLDLTVNRIISNTSWDVTYGTGLAIEIPEGYVGLIFPRSSIRKMDLLLTNSVGVIDSGYRGEIQLTFKKVDGFEGRRYEIGERAAQIMIIPYPKTTFIEVDELSSTERGDGGFGSTGS